MKNPISFRGAVLPSRQSISIVFSDDVQAVLLEGDARLVVTYGDPTGEDDCLPDPVVDLTVGGERMMIPMYWDLCDQVLLPHVGGFQSMVVRDRRAGAMLTIGVTDEHARVDLDASASPHEFDDLVFTTSQLATLFSVREWRVHALEPQLELARNPELKGGLVTRLAWTVIWRRDAALAIVRDLDPNAQVLTVDQYEIVAGFPGVAWQRMIPVLGSAPAEAAAVIAALPHDCGVELIIMCDH